MTKEQATREALRISLAAMNAMLTEMGMDEDAWNKITFEQMREAVTVAQEALQSNEQDCIVCEGNPKEPNNPCFNCGRERQSNEQVEPVGEIGKIVMFGGDLKEVSWKNGKMPPVGSILYTIPPQRTWVGLDDEEIQTFSEQYAFLADAPLHDFAKAIEAKLKEKNSIKE